MKTFVTFILLLTICYACKKESVSSNGKDPYDDNVQPAVIISKNGISPAKGAPNDEVTVSGKGFAKNKDKLVILFNGQRADIISLTDTTVRVRVPALAGTGSVSAQVEQQYFFGPFFRVLGSFEMDTLFPGDRGANNMIADIIPVENGKYLIVGAFNNYDNANIDGGVNCVARINHDGTLDRSFTYGKKTGTNTFVNTGAPLPRGEYLVAGGFNSYEGIGYVNSIAKLYSNGSLQTVKTKLASGTELQTSAMKGGVSGQVNNLLLQQDGKMVLTGAFRYYVQPNFSLTGSTGLDSIHLDSIQATNIIRLQSDGSIDSTFNYDLVNHRGKESVNGFIGRTLLLPDGKIIITGNFTRYNGQDARRIARLNPDGSLDMSFNTGAGADQPIYSITRQPDGKYIIVGAFNNYNGQTAPHVARLNEDGTLDPSFRMDQNADGYIFSADVMPGGEIILSGTFQRFGYLLCNNIVVLRSDGAIHPTYNTNGGVSLGERAVSGGIARIVQQPAEKAMLIVGSFTKYDYRNSNRIVRVKYK
ncbi:MAG TPA: IPT/TIG domain-containing protein [Chitinophaga sp.]|uniref:IPT/TIG domain-containing protein n=1 Tax=Chitinophaga sp. TaxID=1869181 RepID=UPI002C3F9713|nr:IPT/TIG domain-containing protein [Chitinophaga sp.]HVI48117.1 IPT/TIG domain-containing protein [Chitinophaga sp.]